MVAAHFDEDQIIPIAHDQIQFAKPTTVIVTAGITGLRKNVLYDLALSLDK